MSSAYRHSNYLPWYTASADERRFQIISLVVLIIALLLGTIIPIIELPEKERFKKQTLPPRLARLILEQKKEPPKPKKIVKKKLPEPEKKKPEKKPEEKKKPEPKKKPEKQVVKKKPTKQDARKKAASAGLLAFADQLADLREEQIESNVRGSQRLSTTGKKTYRNQRSIISSGVTSGSGGINTAALSRGTGGTGLSSRKTTEVESAAISDETKAAARSGGKGKDYKGFRTREEIQLVFDQNKGAVYALYNRALRKDPSLRGKVVLELTITPAGKVTKCVILSSELNDPKLERKLVSRIKLFKFPAKDVDTAVVSYPIDFLPS
ncbi:AgmX/PglI C-terminal domain-containing protein [Candidatus Thiodiazotropha sp. CDECU1]|uniref:AgmX/PglI C-terminal domain-containing protein n=1 Tax=Candidatus Thiodiazotropha sp. CDECU1 TaxID=3065865 RepID=UPI00292D7F9B|nr:AgmX/PglI C-terminal domain-containing protein [Candidatus Thiodiazotropha sp. CDECU1]